MCKAVSEELITCYVGNCMAPTDIGNIGKFKLIFNSQEVYLHSLQCTPYLRKCM